MILILNIVNCPAPARKHFSLSYLAPIGLRNGCFASLVGKYLLVLNVTIINTINLIVLAPTVISLCRCLAVIFEPCILVEFRFMRNHIIACTISFAARPFLELLTTFWFLHFTILCSWI